MALPPPRAPVAPEARRAVALLLARWHAFSDLRALADIVLTRGGGGSQRFTGVVLAAAPGSVRFEALSPMGQPLVVATVHEGRLIAYDASTNQAVVQVPAFLNGRTFSVTPANVLADTPVTLSVRDSGTAPVATAAPAPTGRTSPETTPPPPPPPTTRP